MTAAAGAGLVFALGTSASAAGGSYSATTSNQCASASGTYHWYATNTYNGKQAYKTDWDFTVKDLCSTNGRTVSLYTKYSKFTNGAWVNDGNYHKIAAKGTGADVADVALFICEVNYADTCKKLA